MIYPLVREMAAAGALVRVPVAVACRVLGFSEQAYYKWLKHPVSARERVVTEASIFAEKVRQQDVDEGTAPAIRRRLECLGGRELARAVGSLVAGLD